MWSWYVTWGVIVVAPAAVGWLRTASIVISTFWAFVGMTAVHGIYMRMLHTFVLTDLLLVAMLLAVAISPSASSPSGGGPRAAPAAGRPRPVRRRRRRHHLSHGSAARRRGARARASVGQVES